MFVVDAKGAQYAIDEGLRERAGMLIDSFHEKIGYIDLDKIIFLRLTGSPKGKWLGKCMYIGACPVNIIPKFVAHRLHSMGLLNLANTSMANEDDIDLFDLRYIIIINDDLIQLADGDLQRVEDVTLLHELMHIHPNENKLVKHDIEDFVDLVDRFGAHWTSGIFKDEDVDFENGEVVDEIPQAPGIPIIVPKSSTENWTPPESN